MQVAFADVSEQHRDRVGCVLGDEVGGLRRRTPGSPKAAGTHRISAAGRTRPAPRRPTRGPATAVAARRRPHRRPARRTARRPPARRRADRSGRCRRRVRSAAARRPRPARATPTCSAVSALARASISSSAAMPVHIAEHPAGVDERVQVGEPADRGDAVAGVGCSRRSSPVITPACPRRRRTATPGRSRCCRCAPGCAGAPPTRRAARRPVR